MNSHQFIQNTNAGPEDFCAIHNHLKQSNIDYSFAVSKQKTLPLFKPEQHFKVGAWIRFVRELGLQKLFQALPDPREASHTTYSLATLVMWAFSVCSFRQPSKNALQTALENLSPSEQKGMLYFIDSQQIPCSSTVDDALARINYEHFNTILLQLLDRLNKRHFFYNHIELIPDNVFYIGVDGFWTHTYTIPHAVDEKGCNCCPYCLPRKHHPGTSKEFITWIHICVTVTLICEGITLPLYVYPLKATQVNTEQTDADLKQECELVAAKIILSLIRKRYPYTKFTFLGDALYANSPFIQLLNSLGFDYTIVCKEDNLKSLHRKCDELAKTEIYQKNYTHQELESKNGNSVYKQAAWFNKVYMGNGVFTNALRFKEEVKHQGVIVDIYKSMWLCSQTISKSTCFKRAKKGRLRWNHEDVHNTCKNRYLDAKHDMARANPNLLIVWKLLLFIAFFVFEVFRCSTVARKMRSTHSWMQFAQDMLWELIYVAWEIIALSPILKKPNVQFRFSFASGP